MQNIIYKTFKKGSTTYFNSSLFFPKEIKDDVFILYGFVRKADDFIDSIPPQADEFFEFKQKYYDSINGNLSNDIIINSFVNLINRRSFDTEWIDAFLKSMELDLTKKQYSGIDELLEYIYGSAEVIGLMMSSIMGLEKASYPYACKLGRSMQFINFIRDIDEDNQLGRTYLPLNNSGLKSLDKKTALNNKIIFIDFIRNQIKQYLEWQEEAEKGFNYIPHRFLVPIKTASDMYKWTSCEIYRDPFLVFRKKVKPVKRKVFFTILKNFIKCI